MKPVSHWLKSLAILSLTVIATGTPLISSKSWATTADLAQDVDSVEILVPAPELQKSRSINIPVPPPERRDDRICEQFLQPAIDTIIESPSFAGGKWGILVTSLSKENTFYSRNADQYLIPASNVKLLTTAAALQKFDSRTSIGSKSLREWVSVTNLNSNNYYANTLLSRVGGSQVARNILTRLGIDPKSYRQADGSGLSRQNVATPRALVKTLTAMSSAKGREVFYASLPVAGISGTLKNRLRLTPAQGRVHAKTGTLRGVRALSGYLDHPDYGVMVFSIMVNQPSQSGVVLVGAIDEIVLRLTRLTPCR